MSVSHLNIMYDIIVIGAGPAGLTAALYARRADKSVLVIEKSTFGGQITHSPRVENYPCFIKTSGAELADKLVEQVLYQGAEIELDEVTAVSKDNDMFTVTATGNVFQSKAVIIATGSRHRQLGLPKENDFTGEGISYCAVCDGSFYQGQSVAVIGGGNSALQEAVMLSDICSKVTVIQNLPFLTGEKQLINAVESKGNIEIILSSVVTEIIGDDTFCGIEIDTTGNKQVLDFDGVFVAIGQKPENEPFESVVKLDDNGYIVSGESCLPESDLSGIFVAGDCRTKAIRQVATACADGAISALAACRYIDSL